MAIEMILRYYDWSIQDWQNNTYKNLPSVARKVYVKDRSIYRSHAENETILMEPEYIQSEMDDLVKKYSNARAFIRFDYDSIVFTPESYKFRPSGTEQLVRIYVEADSKKDAKDIADKLEFMVREHSK
jgi:phosphoacetylglucosamine mutase